MQLGSDPALLWLWSRLAATASTGSLAWELPYFMGAALKRPEKKKKSNNINIWRKNIPDRGNRANLLHGSVYGKLKEQQEADIWRTGDAGGR